jgi:DnaK suppressor protein
MTDSGISSADLQIFERTLRERRDALEAQLENVLGRSEEECGLALNEDVFGAKEEAMLAELSDTYLADVTRLRKDLAEIDAARKRYGAATYGICTHCRGPIGLNRLLSQATAVRCQPCQAAYEQPLGASPMETLSVR